MLDKNYKEYKVWDLPVRLFHWINFLTVISLIFMGMMMLYKKELGITSLDAKIALKVIHVLIGYVFAANLFIRVIWGFVGNQYARWSSLMPGRGSLAEVRSHLVSVSQGKNRQYVGHNPLGKFAVLAIFLLLLVIGTTGMIRAGTDIYYPPFGSMVVEYIAEPGVSHDSILPYNSTGTNTDKAKELKAFKKPFGMVHIYGAFTLMFLIVLHIFFVVRTEIKEGGSLITAMFSGKKILHQKPADEDS